MPRRPNLSSFRHPPGMLPCRWMCMDPLEHVIYPFLEAWSHSVKMTPALTSGNLKLGGVRNDAEKRQGSQIHKRRCLSAFERSAPEFLCSKNKWFLSSSDLYWNVLLLACEFFFFFFSQWECPLSNSKRIECIQTPKEYPKTCAENKPISSSFPYWR